MNENSNENVNSNKDTTEEALVLADDATEEQKAEYYTKLEDRNKQLFARAKKAEGFELKDGKWVKPEVKIEKKPEAKVEKKDSELSQADLIFIAKTDISQEDVPELIEYAKFKGITLAEAYADGVMKGILAGKAEARRVAEGTNTGGGKRGNAKVSDEQLLENARKGVLPESDADMARLSILARTK